MKVNPIVGKVFFRCDSCANNNKSQINRYNAISATGYTSLGFGVASGILGYRKNMKAHKITAMVCLAAAIAHVALLKTMHSLDKKA